ncbi:helix-turn-helix domain-containing protein [Lactobacillus intestinalis]|jgi:transcriptional regulator with XRE-family HTH domain|uniref:helix-turn-helix domain-containing protein n=1 Tax=Lactobacillus intestinalis TaxID=151781 RepID=UPI0025B0D2B3|nr:helix-turn-helix transcriptional regulator [Lactobacillus intestinalis]
MNFNDEEIGKKIKQYRKGKMTQQELANKIGKTESSIRKYEKGLVKIPLDVLEKIAETLNVSPFILMGDNYYDKKYPELIQKSNEYDACNSYLKALGYNIDSIETPTQFPVEELIKSGRTGLITDEMLKTGNVPAFCYDIKIEKGEISIVMTDEEFDQILQEIKDYVTFIIWRKNKMK